MSSPSGKKKKAPKITIKIAEFLKGETSAHVQKYSILLLKYVIINSTSAQQHSPLGPPRPLGLKSPLPPLPLAPLLAAKSNETCRPSTDFPLIESKAFAAASGVLKSTNANLEGWKKTRQKVKLSF